MAFLSSFPVVRHPGCASGSPPPRAYPTPNRSSVPPAPLQPTPRLYRYTSAHNDSLTFTAIAIFYRIGKVCLEWTCERGNMHIREMHSSLKRWNGGLPSASENPGGDLTALTVYKRASRAQLSCPFVQPSLACATLGTFSRRIPNSFAVPRHPRRIACIVLNFLPIPCATNLTAFTHNGI